MMIRREDMSPEAWASMCTPINEILPRDANTGALFVGSWLASVDKELLDEHRIHQVVAVNDGILAAEPPQDGRNTYKVVIADSTRAELKPFLKGVCRYISDKLGKGENVLVHCQQGISRSSSVVIAYLIQEKGMGYDDALQFVRSKRICAKPNSGFERTLREWETEVRS